MWQELQNMVAKAKQFIYKAAMQTLHFDLVTPQATFFSGEALRVEAPGTLGDFGVLAGHMPFISTLKPGVVSVLDSQNATRKLFVAGGIAEVNPKSCTILAEQVVDLEGYSRADAETRLTKAQDAAENAFSEEAKILAAKELDIAQELLRVVG